LAEANKRALPPPIPPPSPPKEAAAASPISQPISLPSPPPPTPSPSSPPAPTEKEIQLSREVTRLEGLGAEKARECSSLQGEIDELKTTLAEKSKEVNRLKGELSVKANEITTLECSLVKLNEEMKKMNQDHLDKLSCLQSELEEVKLENEKLKSSNESLQNILKWKYFHDLPDTHLRIEEDDLLHSLSRGSTNRILEGHIRLYGRDQSCKFKIIQETLDSDSKTISVSRSRLENETNILMKLQFHSGGSLHHVKCLDNRLEWNHPDGEEQDLYVVSSETGCVKNDENSKPRVCGLVLESGGLNLAQFLRDPLHSPSRFGIIARVNILKEIVDALEFLEKHRIVHGDLKPENIVSFHRGNGTTCWKLIDFDNSHDLTSLSSRSPPKISHT